MLFKREQRGEEREETGKKKKRGEELAHWHGPAADRCREVARPTRVRACGRWRVGAACFMDEDERRGSDAVGSRRRGLAEMGKGRGPSCGRGRLGPACFVDSGTVGSGRRGRLH